MATPALVLKAAASILANEKSRKAVGWVLIRLALLPPMKRRRGCRTTNGSPGQMVHGGRG